MTPELVLRAELTVLEQLSFSLLVFHPYRPLRQYVFYTLPSFSPINVSGTSDNQPYFAGICRYLKDLRAPEEMLQVAWTICNDMYFTDLCMTVPPYLQAIVAIFMSATAFDRDVTEWLRKLHVSRPEVRPPLTKTSLTHRGLTCRGTGRGSACLHTAQTDERIEHIAHSFSQSLHEHTIARGW